MSLNIDVPRKFVLTINNKTYSYDTEQGKIIVIFDKKIKNGDNESVETVIVKENNGLILDSAHLTQWNENKVDLDLGKIKLTFYDHVRKPSVKQKFIESFSE